MEREVSDEVVIVARPIGGITVKVKFRPFLFSCFSCRKMGHQARDCPEKKKEEEVVEVHQVVEDPKAPEAVDEPRVEFQAPPLVPQEYQEACSKRRKARKGKSREDTNIKSILLEKMVATRKDSMVSQSCVGEYGRHLVKDTLSKDVVD